MYGLFNLNGDLAERPLGYQVLQSGDIQICRMLWLWRFAELARYDLQDNSSHSRGSRKKLFSRNILSWRRLNKLAEEILKARWASLNYQVGVEGKSAEQAK